MCCSEMPVVSVRCREHHAILSPRERQVLSFLLEGATNREISRELRISRHTVKSHVTHIFNKLGVENRTQAAVVGTRLGLTEPVS